MPSSVGASPICGHVLCTGSRCGHPRPASTGRMVAIDHMLRTKIATGDGQVRAQMRTSASGWATMHRVPAGVAQSAEQPSCKRQASGSNPLTGSQARRDRMSLRSEVEDLSAATSAGKARVRFRGVPAAPCRSLALSGDALAERVLVQRGPSPVWPSISSLAMSRCPACRAVSSIMCSTTQRMSGGSSCPGTPCLPRGCADSGVTPSIASG